ncbi:MAG TPA: ABC transporter substrate-binding protein [Anaerolineae bacterium]|nr:ABC transporter substrate-binding protein [Anaerolineae bacterium]
MRSRYLLSLLLVVSFVLTACQPAAAPTASTGPIKIAVLAPLSGPVPTFGVSTRDGALLAIEEWNAKGGVLGQPIEAVVEDSQCTADPAVNAANKVIDQDKVHYIIGEVCSKASIPISEIAEEKGVVQISPTSTNPQVTKNADGSTKQYVFRACFTDDFQGAIEAKLALETLKAQNAFILFDQGNDYVRGLAEYFEKSFVEGGGTILGKETYTAQDTDFSAILAKVAEAQPDVLLVPDYYNIVNLVGAQAKEKGISSTMLGGDGWDSPDLDAQAADGGYFTNHYAPDEPRPTVQDFVKNYQAKYGVVPDALAALAYDATNMMLKSIEKAGVDDPAKVKDVLASETFEAVSGTIKLDENHNPIKTVTILQVKDGKVQFLTQVK